jgi:hypothetical protein
MDDSRIPYKQRIAAVAQLDQALYSSEVLNHFPVPLCRILCMRRCLYSLSVLNNEDSRVFCRFSVSAKKVRVPLVMLTSLSCFRCCVVSHNQISSLFFLNHVAYFGFLLNCLAMLPEPQHSIFQMCLQGWGQWLKDPFRSRFLLISQQGLEFRAKRNDVKVSSG